ncbi:MAG: hypothetical protein ABMA02_10580 [Saprospiraceae bacterium]
MNKKFLFGGLVAVTAFAILSAFGGQTLEQQKQEIASAITAQLDEFRAQKQQECTDRVNAEAQTRYDAYVAALPPAKPEATPKKKTAPKKAAPTPSKTPLPQTPPQPAVQESQSKWNPNNPGGVQESKSKWQTTDPAKKDAATPPAPVQESKSKWQKKSDGSGGK